MSGRGYHSENGGVDSERSVVTANTVIYRERPRIPWFTAAYVGAIASVLAVVGLAISAATGGRSYYPFGVIVIGSSAAFGAFVALISGRTIRLESDTLWIGRKVVPLGAITQTGVLRGRDLWRVRNRIALPGSRSAPLLLGSAVPGIGDAFAGAYLLSTRSIRAGNCCSPGQGPAVVLLTPSLETPVWLVGSRNAAELEMAV